MTARDGTAGEARIDTKKIDVSDPRNYCQNCRKFLGGKCDIMGEIEGWVIERCQQAGYREIKYSNCSVRRY